MNLPLFIEQRRRFCRVCPNASRSNVGGTVGVSLQSECKPAKRTIRETLTNPDAACPLGHFGRAVADPKVKHGGFSIERGKISGWEPVRTSTSCGGCGK